MGDFNVREFYPINPRNPCSRQNLEFVENHAPLRRNATIKPVGNAVAFLLSDLAAGVTTEIVPVDSGLMPWSAVWLLSPGNYACCVDSGPAIQYAGFASAIKNRPFLGGLFQHGDGISRGLLMA